MEVTVAYFNAFYRNLSLATEEDYENLTEGSPRQESVFESGTPKHEKVLIIRSHHPINYVADKSCLSKARNSQGIASVPRYKAD